MTLIRFCWLTTWLIAFTVGAIATYQLNPEPMLGQITLFGGAMIMHLVCDMIGP